MYLGISGTRSLFLTVLGSLFACETMPLLLPSDSDVATVQLLPDNSPTLVACECLRTDASKSFKINPVAAPQVSKARWTRAQVSHPLHATYSAELVTLKSKSVRVIRLIQGPLVI